MQILPKKVKPDHIVGPYLSHAFVLIVYLLSTSCLRDVCSLVLSRDHGGVVIINK
jgi:hypothetical protein